MDEKQAVGAVINSTVSEALHLQACLVPCYSSPYSFQVCGKVSGVFGEPWRCHGDLSSLPSCLSDCQILRKEEDP